MLSIRKSIPVIIAFAGLVLLGSCEKVIDVDLNSADKRFVIEATITDQPGVASVRITQTKNFDENNTFPGVSGAVVTVTEVGGATTAFTETAPGVYTSSVFAGHSGKTYQLSVSVQGNTFTAQSTMPQRVNLDTAYVTDEALFTETQKTLNIVFQDPPGLGNNYRFVQYVNDVMEPQIMVENDDYTDGKKIMDKLFYFDDTDDERHTIHSGDKVRVDMFCIDAAAYKYWYSLDRSATGNSGQATPANPVTNLQGGALGYFSAQTMQTKTIIAP